MDSWRYRHDLKAAWERYTFVKNFLNEQNIDKAKTNELLKPYKENIRDIYRQELKMEEDIEYEDWKAPYGDDGYDRRYCKFEVPYLMSEDDMAETREDMWCHWYNPYGDGRDCTGVWFTSYILMFPIKDMNKTIIYHFQSCDV